MFFPCCTRFILLEGEGCQKTDLFALQGAINCTLCCRVTRALWGSSTQSPPANFVVKTSHVFIDNRMENRPAMKVANLACKPGLEL